MRADVLSRGHCTTMKALTWYGKNDIRCETVPDPKIQNDRDAIIKVTACAICGSDLHLFDGVMPSMEKGDVLGHETMGEVVEVGAGVARIEVDVAVDDHVERGSSPSGSPGPPFPTSDCRRDTRRTVPPPAGSSTEGARSACGDTEGRAPPPPGAADARFTWLLIG